MAKIPSCVKVHAFGQNFNDSLWISVTKNLEMYVLTVIYPGTGVQYPRSCVPGYEVKEEIMSLLGSMYEGYNVEQINLTWNYNSSEP